MFNINEYIIYGLHGVSQITDIIKDEEDKAYYVIKPQNSSYTIKTPVDNNNTFMRTILSRNEVMSLIGSMPKVETTWTIDSKQRSLEYKALMKTGRCEDLIKVIRTLHLKKEKSLERNKVTTTDNEILKAAKKMLHDEFAVALEILSDQVEDFIREHI